MGVSDQKDADGLSPAEDARFIGLAAACALWQVA
jgi:hypothetical protein